jgi:hypothetical protein
VAQSQGFVTGINWLAGILCVFVGTPTAEELLTIQFRAADDAAATERKRGLAKALTTAFVSRRLVSVTHGDSDPAVLGVAFPRPNISPVGPAIHGDFYAVTGSGIPADAEIVFERGFISVILTPDLRRPHWLLVDRLPAIIPAGIARLFLRGAGWQSDTVPVRVMSGPPEIARTLYPGRPATSPYTFLFAASPAAEASGAIVADGILNDRPGFNDLVAHCLTNLLTVTEDLLRVDGLDREIRFVAIFDPTQSATAANALVRYLNPNMTEALRARLNGFVRRYGENPDMVFCVSNSTVFTRATAWFTSDDNSRPGVSYTYDGVARTHRRFTDIPGSAALSTAIARNGLTAIHEFGHAASDFANGAVIDLYVDGVGSLFNVNKKARAQATDPVPANFANYQATQFAADAARDGLGYPSNWTSYHAAPRDGTRPNLMDNYWQTAQPQRCRLDRLTYAWFRDRLRAKVRR